MTIQPAVAVAGSAVSLDGAGFPGGRARVTVAGQTARAQRPEVRAGRFKASVQVPSGVIGTVRVASGVGSRRVVNRIRVVSAPPPGLTGEIASAHRVRLRWTPTTAAPLASVELSVLGAPPRRPVKFFLAGERQTRRASRGGSVTIRIRLPRSARGRQHGWALAGGVRLRFVVVATPPDPPSIQPPSTLPPGPVGVPTAPTPGTPPPPPTPDPERIVIAGAGDIADADRDAEKTAKLLDAINPDVVFTTGDNAYEAGAASEYANYYAPTWGRHAAKTRPVPGNHEWLTSGASGYFGYFGLPGYYAYDLGASWRLYALDSNCSKVGGCSAGSPQYEWLKSDLATNPRRCVLAYWHHPRFSSGKYSDDDATQPFWQLLYDAGAEIVLNGHDHNYQRYTPLTPSGASDPARGLREFVVGMGGKNHIPVVPAPVVNREAVDASTFGVLKLTLGTGRFDWQFVPEAGMTFADAGNGVCH